MATLTGHFPVKHKCELTKRENHELPRVAPYATPWRKFVGGSRRWLLISRWHHKSKFYFRSFYGIYKEKRRHIKNRRYLRIIHPFSRFCIIEQKVIGVLWMISFLIDPYMASFLSNYVRRADRTTMLIVNVCLNLFYIFHMISRFFTGYAVDRTKEIVLEPKRIAEKYIKSYFFFDFVATTYSLVQYFLRNSSSYKVISMYPLYVLRCARLPTTVEYLTNFMNMMKVRADISRCITMCCFTLFLLHWWTCAFYLLPCVAYYLGFKIFSSWVIRAAFNPLHSQFAIYSEIFLSVVCHFFGAGKGSIQTSNSLEQMMFSLVLMCGVTCHIYVIAVTLQLFGTMNISESKYGEVIYQLNEYMVMKKLEPKLRKRLTMYYEYRFQKQFFLESVILNSLSEHLRLEVCLYSCRNLIDKVRIFQGTTKDVIGTIVSMLKHEIFLPGDMIIKPDSINENVYFISFGTCAAYLLQGQEVVHLEDGHHFGEVHIILQDVGRKNFTSVVAIEITEVFYLTKKDFMYCINAHPDIGARLESVALNRLNMYRTKMEAITGETFDVTDILQELKRGRLLDKRKQRH